jgi:hypothetical protein
MKTKICMKCRQRKPVRMFYKHPQMADGHLGKCKTCTKKGVRENYQATIKDRHAYERRRWKDPDRRKYVVGAQKRNRERYPGKYRARYVISNALRDGRLVRKPCKKCGTTKNVQAHHKDYRKPLEVDWLCFKCHREDEHGQLVLI